MGTVINGLRNSLYKRLNKKYLALVREQDISYDAWIREKEKGLRSFDMTVNLMEEDISESLSELSYAARIDDVSLRIVPYSRISGSLSMRNYLEDIIVFANGELTERALPLIVDTFNKYPEVSIVYGDEDIARLDVSESDRYGKSIHGTRENPFFKPDWSPNAFLDHFYFCNIVALRRSSFRDVSFGESGDGAENLYETLIKYIYANDRNVYRSVSHIDEVLIHVKNYEANRLKPVSPEKHVKNMIVPEFEESIKNGKVKVSAVIPSRDNSGLIDECISSLIKNKGGSTDLEIIVVDNGSSDEERDKYTALSKKYGFRYEYMPMEFNFACMCNYGASLSSGDALLFLNDDVTVTDESMLDEMISEVMLKFTGAVGVKLLYPDSNRIQHAGVMNTRIGPVHKLQFMDDGTEYYHGFNRSVNNVLSVTGACLMVRADAYKKVNGMNEILKVAFNDMDLCYKLFEAGYMNVVLNNCHAVHAESLTRGRDTDAYSLRRLNDEKEKLFNIHPAFRFYDPFYSKYLNSDCLDVRIAPASEYEYSRASGVASQVRSVDLSAYREEPCVRLSVEYAGALNKYIHEEGSRNKDLYVQGFAYVSGSDNALYKRSLILSTDKASYSVDINRVLRKDVSVNCPDEVNVALSGFSVKIPAGTFEHGEYRVGVLFEKMYSGEKLYVFSNKYLVVR